MPPQLLADMSVERRTAYWGRVLATPRHDGHRIAVAHASPAEGGFELAVLWVVTGNTRARRFYERSGWHADGVTREDDQGGFLIPEVRYVRELAPTA